MGFLFGLAVGVLAMLGATIPMIALSDVKDLGQWAQAIGGLIAVGVAIYIPLKMRTDEREEASAERELKAKLLASILLPEVVELRNRAVRVRGFLAEYKSPELTQLVLDLASEIRIAVPGTMLRTHSDLYLLGTALGTQLHLLVTMCEAQARDIEEMAIIDFTPDAFTEVVFIIEDTAERLIEPLRTRFLLQ
jgi:hypothetical protein